MTDITSEIGLAKSIFIEFCMAKPEGETEYLYVVPSTNLRVQYSFRAKIQSLKEMESQFQTWSLVGRSVSDFWSKTLAAEISRPHNNTSKENELYHHYNSQTD